MLPDAATVPLALAATNSLNALECFLSIIAAPLILCVLSLRHVRAVPPRHSLCAASRIPKDLLPARLMNALLYRNIIDAFFINRSPRFQQPCGRYLYLRGSQ